MTKPSKSSSKRSSVTSSPISPSPSIANNKAIGANSLTTKNTHNSVNLKNLKNLSSKIATIVPPPPAPVPVPVVVDDGPSKQLLKQQLVHSNKSVEALGVLMQYLVYHVSIFFE